MSNDLSTGALSKLAGTAFDLLDPSKARRAISGLLPGGASSIGKQATTVGFRSATAGDGVGAGIAIEDDWRVRISLSPQSSIFYKDANNSNSILTPLIETNGVIFPYTPTITVNHTANYSSVTPTHSNYSQHFYNNSEVTDISISGEFTVQNQTEGQYLMAAIYFFRAATKMFFGQGANAGNPPPIVFLDGYGSHYFPHVPCVVTSFSHTLSPDVDYIQVPISTSILTESTVENNSLPPGVNDSLGAPIGMFNSDAFKAQNPTPRTITKQSFSKIETSTRLPTSSAISITVKPMYSRKNLHDRFNLDDFAGGKLLSDKDKGYGGFI